MSEDLDGIIKTWNPGAERLFGYTAEEAIGKPITLSFPMDRHHEESDMLPRLQRGERIDHYETVRRRKDGGLVEISLTVSPLKKMLKAGSSAHQKSPGISLSAGELRNNRIFSSER